jgi:hypothetical protein
MATENDIAQPRKPRKEISIAKETRRKNFEADRWAIRHRITPNHSPSTPAANTNLRILGMASDRLHLAASARFIRVRCRRNVNEPMPGSVRAKKNPFGTAHPERVFAI